MRSTEKTNKHSGCLKKRDLLTTMPSLPLQQLLVFPRKGNLKARFTIFHIHLSEVTRVWSEWTRTKLKALYCGEERPLESEAGPLRDGMEDTFKKTHSKSLGRHSLWEHVHTHLPSPPPSFTFCPVMSLRRRPGRSWNVLARGCREGTLHSPPPFPFPLPFTPPLIPMTTPICDIT